MSTMNADPDQEKLAMSSNIMWFADIKLADLEQVGGKNSSLGEMISNLSAGRCACSRRIRHDRECVPAFHR